MVPSVNSDLEMLRMEGDAALGKLIARHRAPLERMVEFRLDYRLRGRVDAADVIQEAYLEAARRLSDYLAQPGVTFFVWIRQLTLQALIGVHRRHFRDKRSVAQEVSLRHSAMPGETSYSIAAAAIAGQTSPSEAAMKAEEISRLRAALDTMDPIDREVLALRHFEHLGNNDVAEILNLSVTAASNRYVRAMARLGALMQSAEES